MRAAQPSYTRKLTQNQISQGLRRLQVLKFKP